MEILYVVLYEKYPDYDTSAIAIYHDEEKANRRVRWERVVIESDPESYLRDECWYQEVELKEK